ncbi:hypothetical protein QQ045_029321 [Rhodiola kirilowii]
MASSVNKDSSVSLSYPMLSRNNYTAWAIKMKVFMEAQGVWDVIESTEEIAVETKRDEMALSAIYKAIPEEVLLFIAEKKTAKEAWNTLKTMHLGADRVKNAKSRLHHRHEYDDHSFSLTLLEYNGHLEQAQQTRL